MLSSALITGHLLEAQSRHAYATPQQHVHATLVRHFGQKHPMD